MSFHNLYKYWT